MLSESKYRECFRVDAVLDQGDAVAEGMPVEVGILQTLLGLLRI